MSRQIYILGGRSNGKTELIRAWLAFSRRLAQADIAIPRLANLPVLGAPEAAAYEEDEVTAPGAAFSQWFAVHDIPSLVARYAR